jgi:uncharacterized membrane protein YfcA
MLSVFSSFNLSSLDWLLIAISAMLIGMSKTGVPGVSMIVVPTLAMIFGGKQSTGVLLPILIMADVFGVVFYHRHAEWKHLLRALPWALAGLILALWIGNLVNDEQFKRIIAITVFVSIGLMVWKDKGLKNIFVPEKWWFSAIMGVAGGFATMIGNVAGPVFAIYLLAMHLPKNSFIGTTAWFFAIVNLTKLPLQIIVWENINFQTTFIDLLVFPFIALGAWLGIMVVKRIPDHSYRWIVITITLISAFLILV